MRERIPSLSKADFSSADGRYVRIGELVPLVIYFSVAAKAPRIVAKRRVLVKSSVLMFC